ncbi:MAG: cupin domain-containing protein [Ruminococcaceae bacterium]|nr:cupin domain-containing protein [Oscillospiraceae bacterium]
MIEQYSYTDEGWNVLMESGEWKIGMLRHNERFSKFSELEIHMLTDEAFVLLAGSATLNTDSEQVEMKPLTVYNIPAGVWHHIVVSEDASVLVVENRNTSKENTKKKYLNTQGGRV